MRLWRARSIVVAGSNATAGHLGAEAGTEFVQPGPLPVQAASYFRAVGSRNDVVPLLPNVPGAGEKPGRSGAAWRHSAR